MEEKMKKLKCKKEYGIYYYIKENPTGYGICDLRFPIYHLYNEEKEYINSFGYYNDMKYYLETGIVI